MLKTIFLLTYSFVSLTNTPNLSLVSSSEYYNQKEFPTIIKHKTIEQTHILIFANLLSIPENNYNRFFQRMQKIYPMIISIERIEESNQIELSFYESLPQSEMLDQILQKFSIKDYSISIYD
jgi:hypothetical protein